MRKVCLSSPVLSVGGIAHAFAVVRQKSMAVAKDTAMLS